ncbi:transposable element Tcb2 transposase [Trichonephila clavipes]|nr:transposable element Tcb2 transposase [Trichonephila clavipes]
MSARYDLHLCHMAVNDLTAFCMQLVVRWSTATNALMSASSIRRRLLHRELRASAPLYRISLTANHQCLRRQ